MVMPAEHQDSLRADLRKATSVLTIGWRGREAHFVKELTNCLPAGLPLVAVAENEEAAQETTDHLLATGRFDAYCNVGGGFSKFAPMETTYSHDKSPAKAPTLGAMLRDLISYRASVDGRVRVTMQPQLPVVRAPYVDFPGRAGTR
jgi:hypothetical protein